MYNTFIVIPKSKESFLSKSFRITACKFKAERVWKTVGLRNDPKTPPRTGVHCRTTAWFLTSPEPKIPYVQWPWVILGYIQALESTFWFSVFQASELCEDLLETRLLGCSFRAPNTVDSIAMLCLPRRCQERLTELPLTTESHDLFSLHMNSKEVREMGYSSVVEHLPSVRGSGFDHHYWKT